MSSLWLQVGVDVGDQMKEVVGMEEEMERSRRWVQEIFRR